MRLKYIENLFLKYHKYVFLYSHFKACKAGPRTILRQEARRQPDPARLALDARAG